MLENIIIVKRDKIIDLPKSSTRYEYKINLISTSFLFIGKILKLDVDPQRDDDASPMSSHRCMLRPTWMISALQHKSK